MTDEELQNNIERNPVGESLEERSYRKVFTALRKEPAFQLTPHFANRVMGRLNLSVGVSSRKDLYWLYAGIACFVVAMIVTIALTSFRFTLGGLKFIAGYPGLFVFGIIFILGLQWIDKRIVHKTRSAGRAGT